MPDPLEYDLILRNGTLFDGSGQPGIRGDLALQGQTIAALGDLQDARARQELDVSSLAVAPGFINMLSWSTESLIADGRSQSDIRQGVTLEVMGEGFSFGPLNESMKADLLAEQADIKYPVVWTTLNEYLEHLVARGVSCNVASFVAPPPCAFTSLDTPPARPTRPSWTRCASWCARQWPRAHWA